MTEEEINERIEAIDRELEAIEAFGLLIADSISDYAKEERLAFCDDILRGEKRYLKRCLSNLRL